MKATLILLCLLIGAKNLYSQNTSSIVDIKSILINGKIPITTSKKIVENYFGKNYTKESYQPECGMYDSKEFYNLKFFIYKKNGIQFFVYKAKADFDEIDLTKNDSNFVQLGKFKINNQTSLDDLKQYFPKSFKEYKEDYKNEKNVKESFFRLIFDKNTDDKFLIELNDKNKVVRCSYFFPC
jgi:hypothetical protein